MTEHDNKTKNDSAVAAALTVGVESESAAPHQSRRASRIVAWCVAAVAVVAIAVCGWTIASSTQQWGEKGLAPEAAVVQDAGDQLESAAEASGDDATSRSEDASEASLGAASDSVPASAGNDATSALAPSESSSSGFASAGASSSAGTTTPAGSASGSHSGSDSSGGQAPTPNTVTVTVTIDSSAAGSPVSLSTALTFEKGATVYDALVGTGVAVGASQTAYGAYVSSIGGLAEKQHGASSGWTYYVNGGFVNTSCSSYVLSDGDSVYWTYVNVIE